MMLKKAPFLFLLSQLLIVQVHAVDPANDTSDLAANMVEEISSIISSKYPGPKTRVAVFPPVNPSRKVVPLNSEPTISFQGELCNKLREKNKGKFFVLMPEGLSNEYSQSDVDTSQISYENNRSTADALKKMKIDAGVLLRFDVSSNREAREKGGVDTSAKIVFSDGSIKEIGSVPSNPSVIPSPGNQPSKRFSVEILVDNQPLELKICKDPSSEYFNVFFLELDPSMIGKEYQIRIRNNGSPELRDLKNANDRDRLFAAAVMVDGVNSIFQKNPIDGSNELQAVHPKNATKWVLSPPGKNVISGKTVYVKRNDAKNVEEIVDQNTDGAVAVARAGIEDAATQEGQSSRTVGGFQVSLNSAKAFKFANASDSVAARINVTDYLGMISVHFFAERMDGDKYTITAPGIGTKIGREYLNPVKPVWFPKYRDNVMAVRIFYRLKGELPPVPLETFIN
jgi:hypothetical protein